MIKFVPLEKSDYIPPSVRKLISNIENQDFRRISLLGFSDNMKWICTLLNELNYQIKLFDWRDEFKNYDCSGFRLNDAKNLRYSNKTLIVICPDDLIEIKLAINYLIDNNFSDIPTTYNYNFDNNPLRQLEPYKTISNLAQKRAVSMISDPQLMDLIQAIRLTKNVEGCVVEFGSLHGGSGSILAEALNYYGKKKLFLFDTFAGIPKSKYGLDFRWTHSFANNSYKEVKKKFIDLNNVEVIKGNINVTHKKITSNVSLGYIASDTFETGRVLLDFIWEKLSPLGKIIVCDYGSFPNCIPLTTYVDKFLSKKKVREVFHTTPYGIIITK